MAGPGHPVAVPATTEEHRVSDRAEPLTVDDGSDDVERILVVTAHPDDVDFGAAGSVATWTGRGIEVAYCIATDGDAGGSDHSITRPEMAAIRREEQLDGGTGRRGHRRDLPRVPRRAGDRRASSCGPPSPG